MKKLLQFVISLLALPFLLPWYLTERLFEYLLQPLLFRRFRIALEPRKLVVLRIAITVFGLALVFYLGYQIRELLRLFPTPQAALLHSQVYFILILNDLIRFFQLVLWPINTALLFVQGGQVKFWELLVALYLCFLPFLMLFNLAFRFISTSRSLGRAVELRNQAVRDVDIVSYAEKAKADEIFLGIDLTRNAPFYARRKWLKGHSQVIGASGSGKTESIIQPIWFQEVRRNVATFTLDGKGSRRNLDKYYTIATSLAQGHEVLYFNPADSERSATYNPVLRGSATEIRQKILSSLNWAEGNAGTRERISYCLDLIIRAIKESGRFASLDEIFQYLTTRTHLHLQLRRVKDRSLYEGLYELTENFQRFQADTEFLSSTLREVCQAEFAWLLDTDDPEIDVAEIYRGRKDCYFTLPMHSGNPGMRFLGQLILQDMMTAFAGLTMQTDDDETGNEGLLIIDEVANFISPSFIELLRVCSNAQVSVCYTNQSFAELTNPSLNLGSSFVAELADHTNATFCFHLGSTDSINAVLERIGRPGGEEKSKAKEGAAVPVSGPNFMDPNFLKHLEVGRCLVHFRQPKITGILKTGYFKFDKLLKFEKAEGSRQMAEA